MECLLKKTFPLLTIQKEYTIIYNGQRLYVDFYLPSFLIAVEVHGRQHDHFVRYFHKNGYGWRGHQKRDGLKEEWADINNITYVVIREKNMPSNKEEMLELIMEAM